MNITELNEQEKSAMLAKVCKWKISYIGNHNEKLLVSTGAGVAGFDDYQDGNLYDPANMALAWRVLNFVYYCGIDSLLYTVDENEARGDFAQAWLDYWDGDLPHIYELSPQAAQTAWLDKILELAIEAGMVE